MFTKKTNTDGKAVQPSNQAQPPKQAEPEEFKRKGMLYGSKPIRQREELQQRIHAEGTKNDRDDARIARLARELEERTKMNSKSAEVRNSSKSIANKSIADSKIKPLQKELASINQKIDPMKQDYDKNGTPESTKNDLNKKLKELYIQKNEILDKLISLQAKDGEGKFYQRINEDTGNEPLYIKDPKKVKKMYNNMIEDNEADFKNSPHYLDEYPTPLLKQLQDYLTLMNSSDEKKKLYLDAKGVPIGEFKQKTDSILKINPKELEYQCRDLSDKALDDQLELWKNLQAQETPDKVKSWVFFKKEGKKYTKDLADVFQKEKDRREKEKNEYYTKSEVQIYNFLDNNETLTGRGKTKEKDAFIKRSVRLLRHIKQLNEDADLKFFARILICLIRKYHDATVHFKLPIDVEKEVKIINLKPLTTAEGKEEKNRYEGLLKMAQTRLNCSSKLSKAKRKALCNEWDLKALLFPVEFKDHILLSSEKREKLSDIIEKGMMTNKEDVVNDLAIMLSIALGRDCQLFGVKEGSYTSTIMRYLFYDTRADSGRKTVLLKKKI
jgi:hypothetical protein